MPSYAKAKGRSNRRGLRKSLNGATYTPLRHDVINSPEFIKLSPSAKAVFIHLLAKYNGFSNGQLTALQDKSSVTFGISPRTLKTALDELIAADFVEVTRHGGRNQCSLYGLTCFPLSASNTLDNWRKT